MSSVGLGRTQGKSYSGHQRRLLGVAQAAAELDLREFEVANVDRILQSLRPRVWELLEQAGEVLSEIQRPCDEAQAPPKSGVSAAPPSEAPSDSPHDSKQAIDDVLLVECDTALRKIRRALAAVDAAMSEARGGVAALELESELAASLSVREAYARFRERLAACGRSSQSTSRRLRLASLAGRDSELDEILHAGTIPDRWRGRAMLERVWRQLSRQGGF